MYIRTCIPIATFICWTPLHCTAAGAECAARAKRALRLSCCANVVVITLILPSILPSMRQAPAWFVSSFCMRWQKASA